MYNWRKMSEEKQAEVLKLRAQCRQPLHSPPHYKMPGRNQYHLTAAVYEHASLIGKSPERMTAFSKELCDVLCFADDVLFAWCVLPNHWHALISTENIKTAVKRVGRLHGKSSFIWNGEEDCRGRQCWHCCADRRIRSSQHFYATRNYIHHNPVKHGYVKKWTEWSFSSALDYLAEVGESEAIRQWKDYPVLDMGKKWDLDQAR